MAGRSGNGPPKRERRPGQEAAHLENNNGSNSPRDKRRRHQAQARLLRGHWPLAGRCTFCSRPIGTAIALIVTPARLGAVCRRCDYADAVALRLVEIASRDGYLRQVALPGGWA